MLTLVLVVMAFLIMGGCGSEEKKVTGAVSATPAVAHSDAAETTSEDMMTMMCPMMGGMMAGQMDPTGMMGMMSGGQMDPKAMARMLALRGDLLKAMEASQ
jgi:hypothetical protein